MGVAGRFRGSVASVPAEADVWDEERWRRSARRWSIGVSSVVVVCVATYLLLPDDSPRVPSRIYLTVAGPDVRILKTGSHHDLALGQYPEDLLVEVAGAGDPVRVLTDTLRSHGWQTTADDASLPSPDGPYVLTWKLASEADSATDAVPLSAQVDRADPRQVVVEIDNPGMRVAALAR